MVGRDDDERDCRWKKNKNENRTFISLTLIFRLHPDGQIVSKTVRPCFPNESARVPHTGRLLENPSSFIQYESDLAVAARQRLIDPYCPGSLVMQYTIVRCPRNIALLLLLLLLRRVRVAPAMSAFVAVNVVEPVREWMGDGRNEKKSRYRDGTPSNTKRPSTPRRSDVHFAPNNHRDKRITVAVHVVDDSFVSHAWDGSSEPKDFPHLLKTV